MSSLLLHLFPIPNARGCAVVTCHASISKTMLFACYSSEEPGVRRSQQGGFFERGRNVREWLMCEVCCFHLLKRPSEKVAPIFASLEKTEQHLKLLADNRAFSLVLLTNLDIKSKV